MAKDTRYPLSLESFDIWLNWERFQYAVRNQNLKSVLSFSNNFPLREMILNEYYSVAEGNGLFTKVFDDNGSIIDEEDLSYMAHHYFIVRYILEFRQDWLPRNIGHGSASKDNLIVSLEALARANLGDPIEIFNLPVFRCENDPYHWLK